MTETTARPVPSRSELPPETGKTVEERPFNSYVGINEAARMTGRSKGQIGNDTKSGRLSFELNDRSQKQYQVSELDRVYGLKRPEEPSQADRQRPDETPTTDPLEIALLRQKVQSQADTIRMLERHTATLEQTINRLLPAPPSDALTTPAEATTTPAQITSATSPAAQPQTAAAPPAHKTLWQRITGT